MQSLLSRLPGRAPPRSSVTVRAAGPHPKPPPSADPDAPSGGGQEDDLRYARPELGLALEARRGFVSEIKKGPLRMNLTRAALYVSSEDDAVATTSPVSIPLAPYEARIATMADELVRLRLPDAGLTPSTSTPQQVEEVVYKYLFEEKRFKVKYGRSGIPKDKIVDSPGVYERSHYAYLDKVLTTKLGSPATYSLILAALWTRLLQAGWAPVRIECRFFDEMPRIDHLSNLSIDSLRIKGEENAFVNTCTVDALIELLRICKRAYWPFRWNTALDANTEYSGGGFFDGAQRILTTTDAVLDALARTAQYRLDRDPIGIFTSTGGGDLRRCTAACERLVLLCGDERPWERRDLAVCYLHLGFVERAQAELKAYRASEHFEMQTMQEKRAVEDLLAKIPMMLAASQEAETVGFGAAVEVEGARGKPLSLETYDELESVLFAGSKRRISIHW